MRNVEPGSLYKSRNETRSKRKTLFLIDLACYSGVLTSLAAAITIGYFTITLAAVQGLRSVYFYLILGVGCSAILFSNKFILRMSRGWMNRVLRADLDRVFNSKKRSNRTDLRANSD